MKKLMMLAVAGMFSVSAAAYACDGMKNAKNKGKSSEQVAKKEAPKPEKKS